MASSSAKRYAQAIIELAREKGTFDAWQQDLGTLEAMVSDRAVQSYLANPSVHDAQKIKAVDTVLQGAQPEARNLAHMLIERRRTPIIPEIKAQFDEAVLAERGIVLVDVTTADPLDEAGQRLVREHLTKIVGKNVELRLHEDPSIIGGIVAQVGDQVIDGSVVNQLRRLRARLNAA